MNKHQRKVEQLIRLLFIILFAALILIISLFGPEREVRGGGGAQTSATTPVPAGKEVPSEPAERPVVDGTELTKKTVDKPKEFPYKADIQSDAGKILSHDILMIGKDYANQYSFLFMDKATGEVIAFNEEKVYTSASLYKLFIAYATLSQVDQGKLTLESEIAGFTVDYLIDAAITVSSNETAYILGDYLGWDNVQVFIQKYGFTDTTFNAYRDTDGESYPGILQTTAKDVAMLLDRLYSGRLLSAKSSAYFLALLEAQQLSYALNTGLGEDVGFAHKTGILDEVSHDAGILTKDNQDYIAVVLTDGWGNATAEATPVFERTGWAIMGFLNQKERSEAK